MDTVIERFERTLTLAERAATALTGGESDARRAALTYLEEALELSQQLYPHQDRGLMEDIDLHLSCAEAAIEDERLHDLPGCVRDARKASEELVREP